MKQRFKQTGTIKIYEGKMAHNIPLADIVYFEVKGKVTTVSLIDKTEIASDRPLNFYARQLHEKNGFFKISRQVMVNCNHIVSMQKGDTFYYSEDNFTKGHKIYPPDVN
jgi:DNA-binding LytR/AlgR family response regulator